MGRDPLMVEATDRYAVVRVQVPQSPPAPGDDLVDIEVLALRMTASAMDEAPGLTGLVAVEDLGPHGAPDGLLGLPLGRLGREGLGSPLPCSGLLGVRLEPGPPFEAHRSPSFFEQAGHWPHPDRAWSLRAASSWTPGAASLGSPP